MNDHRPDNAYANGKLSAPQLSGKVAKGDYLAWSGQ
jgi:hypothetical protein